MKKMLVTGLVCAMAVAAVGCGEKGNEEGASMFENIGTQNEEAKDNNSQQDTEAKSDNKADNNVNNNADNSVVQADLYEAFKAGTAKAKYRGTGDRTSYLETTMALEAGQSYTMDEIVKALESYTADSMELKLSSDVEYRTIDCGQDGVPELVAEAQFGDEFVLHMILKDIGGELVICYDQDSWSRSEVDIDTNGTIVGGGSGGAALHIVDYAYVDANGDYKFYYGVEEQLTLSGDYYAHKSGEDYVTISAEGLDQDHIGIRDYYFDEDYQKRQDYYSYFIMDDNYNDITNDADYDDSNPLKQRFTEAGLKTYTATEIDELLKERAIEIGYPTV